MPNNYTTIVICSPGYGFDVDEFNARHAESDFCRIVKPIPERLEEIKVGHCNGLERWTGDGDPVDENELQQQYGARDWHDWAAKHWGTKWGTYKLKAFELGGDHSPVGIKFQSAWSAPTCLIDIANWLNRCYQFREVSFVGFDPYDSKTTMLDSFSFEESE